MDGSTGTRACARSGSDVTVQRSPQNAYESSQDGRKRSAHSQASTPLDPLWDVEELKQTVLRAAEERILETPIISFKALARAQSTLEDFARTCVCAPLRLGATFP